jgi:signal transduction histidine kinase/tetratricopeptide (TPR) repeat protein
MAAPSTARWRLRWALVLGLVLVPGAVLSFVTWRLIEQERELEASRLEERRALLASRIAQQMISRLERERAAARASPEPRAILADTGVLVFVGPVTERGIELPWESRAPTAVSDATYASRIAEGERREFVGDRPDLAAESYAAAARLAPNPAAEVDARLREARVLARAERAEEALRAYRLVADADPEIRDQDGLPLALYGAEGLLLAEPPDVARIVVTLERVMEVPGLGPPALYALHDLATQVAALPKASAGPDASRRSARAERLTSVQRRAAAGIEVTERLLDLRLELPAVLSLSGGPGRDSLRAPESGPRTLLADLSDADAPVPSAWRPWGPEPWLISASEHGEGMLVFVADSRRLLASLATEGPDDLVPPMSDLRLSTAPLPGAELLGQSFPALYVVFPSLAFQGLGASRSGSILLLFVLPVVLAVTVLAAFLLWRDVQRESHTARMRSQFVSSVSHELKTPLTSIRMYAQTLLMGRPREEADRKGYLETIVNESERLTRLINNVLDFSRMESEDRSYRMLPTSLESVVHESARAMSYPLEEGGFDLRLRIEDGLPDILCDGDALTQAVVNLLSNAVKFSGDARVIELDLMRENGEAVIRVRDHGLGIEKRHHDSVFDQFYRTPEAEADGVPGTGLGLALVAHAARAHQGRVELESAPGRGSTFTIRLPLETEPASA